MDGKIYVIPLLLAVFWLACHSTAISSFDNDDINALMAQVDENDAAFTEKEVVFDSIVTMAGSRVLENNSEPIKIKLFFFGDLARGYYNLSARDDKNLQVFGKKIENYWVFKCVTKINMEEAGGYMILNPKKKGIWSTGHVNFVKGEIALEKKYTDYNSLENW